MDENKRSILLTIYGTHKQEIRSRRMIEILISIIYIISFGLMFCLILTLRYKGLKLLPAEQILGTIFIVIAADVVCYSLTKNFNRQNQLQRAIVNMDTALGLFENGEYLAQGAIYPEEWKQHGKHRPASIATRCIVVVITAVPTLAMIWMN